MIFYWFGGQKLLLEMSIESFRKSKWVFVAERLRVQTRISRAVVPPRGQVETVWIGPVVGMAWGCYWHVFWRLTLACCTELLLIRAEAEASCFKHVGSGHL